MKIVVTGSTGLVGTALVNALARDGHTVCRLLRRETTTGKKESEKRGSAGQILDVAWVPEDPSASSLADSQGKADGADSVVNLAGASIAGGRWTTAQMQLRSSRVRTTRALVAALEKAKVRPKVFVSASAIGIYGNRGDELLTEESKAGEDFLASLTREWEAEARQAQALGARVVLPRFRDHLGQAWRRAAANDASVSLWRRRKDRLRAAVDVVGDAGGCRGDRAFRPGECRGEWRGERGGAAAPSQRAVHQGAGASDAPPRALPRPGVCFASRAGRNGGCIAAGEPAGDTATVASLGYPFLHPDLPSALGRVLHED